jgi:Zn-dependent metalloprotease
MDVSIKKIHHDPYNGTVTLMKGSLYAYSKAIPVNLRHRDKTLYKTIALDFVNHYRRLFKLKNPYAELVVANIQMDKLDYKHIRLKQVYKGIPVWGSELIVHINTDEIIYLAGGHYIPSPDQISLNPMFSEAKAIEYASKQSSQIKPDCVGCKAQLFIYFDAVISPRLAYFVEKNVRFSSAAQLMIDAHTGKLLTHLPNIQI